MAGPRQPAAPGGEGRRHQDHAHARRAGGDPPGDHVRAALAPRAARCRPTRLSRRARRALRAVAGQRRQGPAELGDGRRAGRDLAAVGPHGRADRSALGRAAGRAPRPARVRRPALGPQAGLGGGDRARVALRAADRGGSRGPLRRDRPGALARSLPPARAGRGRMGHAPPLPGGESAAGRGGRGARGPRAPARHPRRRPDAVRLLRRADPVRGGLRHALRPLVARRAALAAGPADVHARAADQPGRRRGHRAGGRTRGRRASWSWR